MLKPRVANPMRGEAPFTTEATGEDRALLAALEQRPLVEPPAAFARRVAQLAAAQPPSLPSRVGSYARWTAWIVAVLLAAGLFAVAPRTHASFASLLFDLELVALLHLALLAWWLAVQPGRES